MAPRFWHPELYQGSSRRRRYFEGWYWKHVTADLSESWSFIPGIARGERPGDGYSFVQAIEGATGRSWWFEYPLEAFSASTRKLVVEVGRNRFSEDGIRLELSGPDGSFEGEVAFTGITRPRSSPWAPGVMGPYSFAPFMECSHGLVSLHTTLREMCGSAFRAKRPRGAFRSTVEAATLKRIGAALCRGAGSGPSRTTSPPAGTPSCFRWPTSPGSAHPLRHFSASAPSAESSSGRPLGQGRNWPGSMSKIPW